MIYVIKSVLLGSAIRRKALCLKKNGDELAIAAAKAALDDCGLKKDDIDGLFVQPSYGRQGDYLKVGLMLGLNPKVGGAVEASGATGCYMIQHAALLLNAGMANYILLVYGTNQKTNRNRFGGALLEEHAPYGGFNPSGHLRLPFGVICICMARLRSSWRRLPLINANTPCSTPKQPRRRRLRSTII